MSDGENLLPASVIDGVLAIQIAVAMAGEKDDGRWNWWRSTFTDALVGADFFNRATPALANWSALDACRRAAVYVDAGRRRQLAEPDRVRTLYFFGFAIDEQLSMRLSVLKDAQASPVQALPRPYLDGNAFTAAMLEAYLQTHVEHPAYSITPVGRQLKGQMPQGPERAAEQLAAALLPLSDNYPMPYYVA